MSIREIITEFRKPEYDYSCSEAILHAVSERYNLNLDKTHFKMMAAYSGGLMSEDACGIVTGALAGLGILFTEGVAHTSPLLKEVVQEYLSRFKSELKTINCFMLKQEYRDDNFGCDGIIIRGAEILEEVVEKYGKL